MLFILAHGKLKKKLKKEEAVRLGIQVSPIWDQNEVLKTFRQS